MKIHEGNFIPCLKRKDEKALDYVIDTYGWLIKSIVNKHLFHLKQFQEECINDVLLAVWYHIDSFKEEKSSFKNWLSAVSKYKCINYKRKYLKLMDTQSIEDVDIESSTYVEKEIMKNDLSTDLESLLGNLKKEDRDLFIKRYVEEKDIDILSKEMSVKTSAIYNRLSRGRNKLRGILGNRLNNIKE